MNVLNLINSAVSIGRVSPKETVFICSAWLKCKAAVSYLLMAMEGLEDSDAGLKRKVLKSNTAISASSRTPNVIKIRLIMVFYFVGAAGRVATFGNTSISTICTSVCPNTAFSLTKTK